MFSRILRRNATDFQKYQCQRDATIDLSTLLGTHQAWCVGLMKALRDRSRIHLGAPRPSLPRNTRLWVEGDLASSSHLRSSSCDIGRILERDDPPKHLLLPSTINSPQCQEVMVSRIFSEVTIFLSPLRDKFTLMEVF